jgi:hypothetical protein
LFSNVILDPLQRCRKVALDLESLVQRLLLPPSQHANFCGGRILKRLAEIDKTLLEHDSALRVIWTKLQPLLAPPPEPPRRRIGFNADNK